MKILKECCSGAFCQSIIISNGHKYRTEMYPENSVSRKEQAIEKIKESLSDKIDAAK